MEIISYVVEGALEHKDSMGTGSLIKPGDIQMMRAGTGIAHMSTTTSMMGVPALQIWVIPNENGLEPGYQQAHRPASDYRNSFRLLVSPDGEDGSLSIAADIRIFGLDLGEGENTDFSFSKASDVWIQVVSGDLKIGEHHLQEGDSLAITSAEALEVSSDSGVDALVFEQPAA